jgi:hypothetical protein
VNVLIDRFEFILQILDIQQLCFFPFPFLFHFSSFLIA